MLDRLKTFNQYRILHLRLAKCPYCCCCDVRISGKVIDYLGKWSKYWQAKEEPSVSLYCDNFGQKWILIPSKLITFVKYPVIESKKIYRVGSSENARDSEDHNLVSAWSDAWGLNIGRNVNNRVEPPQSQWNEDNSIPHATTRLEAQVEKSLRAIGLFNAILDIPNTSHSQKFESRPLQPTDAPQQLLDQWLLS